MAGGSAAGIIAGNAFVRFTVDDGPLKTGLNRVESTMRSFGASAGGVAGEISGKFGSTLAKGIIGAFGVSVADRALNALSETMKEAASKGESASFLAIGVAMGESIAEGLRSVPIAGALGEMMATALAPALENMFPNIFSSDLNSEDRLKQNRAEADAREHRLRMQEEKQQAFEAQAYGIYRAVNQSLANMAGVGDPEKQQFLDQAAQMRDAFTNAGKYDLGQTLYQDLLDHRELAQSLGEWKRKRKDAQSILDSAGTAVDTFGMTDAELQRKRLVELGATSGQLAQFDRDAGYKRLLEMMQDNTNTDMTALGPKIADVERTMAIGTVSARVLADLGTSPAGDSRLKQIADATKETAQNTARWQPPTFGP